MGALLDFDQIEIFNAAIGRMKLGITLYADAPSNGATYGRQNGMWVTLGAIGPSGNLTEFTSSILTITGGTGAVNGSGTSIQVKQATTSTSGYLSATDWNTFNNKQAAGSYLTDAPSNANTYGRKGGAWVVVSGGGIPEAPTDGGIYSRQNAAWYQLVPPVAAAGYGWWKFNEGSGSSAADSSGSGRTGTLINAPAWVTGLNGFSALQFNGSTQGVNVAGQSWTATAITISCWASANWSTAQYGPLWTLNYGATTGIALILSGGASQDWATKSVVLVSNGYNTALAPRGNAAYSASSNGAWHHIVGVIGASGVQIYWDGQPMFMAVSVGGNIPTINTQTIQMGSDAAGDFFNGTLQDVRVYASALTAGQVQALYLAGAQ